MAQQQQLQPSLDAQTCFCGNLYLPLPGDEGWCPGCAAIIRISNEQQDDGDWSDAVDQIRGAAQNTMSSVSLCGAPVQMAFPQPMVNAREIQWQSKAGLQWEQSRTYPQTAPSQHSARTAVLEANMMTQGPLASQGAHHKTVIAQLNEQLQGHLKRQPSLSRSLNVNANAHGDFIAGAPTLAVPPFDSNVAHAQMGMPRGDPSAIQMSSFGASFAPQHPTKRVVASNGGVRTPAPQWRQGTGTVHPHSFQTQEPVRHPQHVRTFNAASWDVQSEHGYATSSAGPMNHFAFMPSPRVAPQFGTPGATSTQFTGTMDQMPFVSTQDQSSQLAALQAQIQHEKERAHRLAAINARQYALPAPGVAQDLKTGRMICKWCTFNRPVKRQFNDGIYCTTCFKALRSDGKPVVTIAEREEAQQREQLRMTSVMLRAQVRVEDLPQTPGLTSDSSHGTSSPSVYTPSSGGTPRAMPHEIFLAKRKAANASASSKALGYTQHKTTLTPPSTGFRQKSSMLHYTDLNMSVPLSMGSTAAVAEAVKQRLPIAAQQAPRTPKRDHQMAFGYDHIGLGIQHLPSSTPPRADRPSGRTTKSAAQLPITGVYASPHAGTDLSKSTNDFDQLFPAPENTYQQPIIPRTVAASDVTLTYKAKPFLQANSTDEKLEPALCAPLATPIKIIQQPHTGDWASSHLVRYDPKAKQARSLEEIEDELRRILPAAIAELDRQNGTSPIDAESTQFLCSPSKNHKIRTAYEQIATPPLSRTQQIPKTYFYPFAERLYYDRADCIDNRALTDVHCKSRSTTKRVTKSGTHSCM